jgi:hypothetical protein
MRKYIGPVKSDNFIYPNNVLEEYDVEIIHDINNNTVSGTTTGFSALYNGGTGNIGISFTYIWNRNGAEPFIDDSGQLHVLSVHMSDPSKKYYKPWRMISGVTTSSITANTVTDTFLIIVTPAMMGVPYFTGGVYDFEVRFIGKKEIYPICQSVSVAVPTPTPTPTITGTPTPSPTPGGPTFTPTPTPTVTPTATPTDPCYCYEIVVTGTTIPGPEGGTIATLDYNDCFGTRTLRAFTVGPGTYKQCIQTLSSVVQWFPEGTEGIDTSNLLIPGVGNCRTGYVCTGYEPANTPTPTPTGAPITATPTPTPTGAPPTDTPTPTPTGLPPTNTPTPTPTATPTATPIPPDCVTTVSFEVDEAGLVSYLNCCGSSVTGFYSIGPQVINDCIDFGTLSGPISSISYGLTSCTCVTPTPTPTATSVPPTNTPTPTPTTTPTATPIPFSITAFTGTTANQACSNFVDPLYEPTILYYSGSLGIGTILYRNNNYTNPVVPTVYCLVDSSTIYVVGTPSPQDGEITGIVACPTPTPVPTSTPVPSQYDVYERCDLTAIYYVDYNAGNLSFVTINSECCSRIDQNVDSAYIASNYPSAIYFSTFTNVTCPCD